MVGDDGFVYPIRNVIRNADQGENHLLIKISLLEFSVTTVESRINEPVYNEVLGITNDFLQPVKITVKCTE